MNTLVELAVKLLEQSLKEAPEAVSEEATRTADEASRLTISVGEAAELLGISRALAYELIARGELPAVHLGRRIVVPYRRLIELL